jgi:glycosyltransferase involved in cell wall biosynthesis
VPAWQQLATGLGGIVPNLRTRPWLIFQVPALIAALSKSATKLASQADLIHAHWVFPSGIAGSVASRKSGLPLLLTSHGGDLNLAARMPVLKPIVRRTVSLSQHCVGVSVAMVEEFRRYGVPDLRLSRIPYGTPLSPGSISESLDQDSDLRSFAEAEGLRILYVGSLIPRKSVATLLEAARRVQASGSIVTIGVVGFGPDLSELREAAASSRLDVRFVGQRRPEAIAGWLSAADVLVLPSLSEGRPLILLEALAMGRAVIATDIAGSRELVQHGRTGFLFPPKDASSLANYLARLAQAPSEAVRMGQAARDWFEAEGLSADAIARRHVLLYERIIGAQSA